MIQGMVNFRMDEDLKREMEKVCKTEVHDIVE